MGLLRKSIIAYKFNARLASLVSVMHLASLVNLLLSLAFVSIPNKYYSFPRHRSAMCQTARAVTN